MLAGIPAAGLVRCGLAGVARTAEAAPEAGVAGVLMRLDQLAP